MNNTSFSEFRIDIYQPRSPVVFNALAGKLGLLTPALVLGVSEFYADLEEAIRGVHELAINSGDGQFSPLIVLKPAVSGVQNVEPVLRGFEKLLGTDAVELPDLGKAQKVIDEEEYRFANAP